MATMNECWRPRGRKPPLPSIKDDCKMRCIFCKVPTKDSKSVEHIVPESLGNKDHVLPRGAVCDGCNNYFAVKVEKPVLDSGMFRLLRSDMAITSKKGRLPVVGVGDALNLPEYRLFARFLGKVGMEVFAFQTLSVEGWNDEIVDHGGLEDLRRFTRYNEGVATWPFAYRTLHPVNAIFKDGEDVYELLHEFDVLMTETLEYYIVLSILGVEFVLNLGGPSLDGYRAWLKKNDYASPLYSNWRESFQLSEK